MKHNVKVNYQSYIPDYSSLVNEYMEIVNNIYNETNKEYLRLTKENKELKELNKKNNNEWLKSNNRLCGRISDTINAIEKDRMEEFDDRVIYLQTKYLNILRGTKDED